MARQTRTFFFSGPTGIIGRLFRTGNIPNEVNYRNLMDSVLMFNEVADTALNTVPGHAKQETDARAIARSTGHPDGHTRFIMSHQLSDLYVAVTAEHAIDTAYSGRGVDVSSLTRTFGVNTKRDWLIENTLAFTSVDNTLAITEAVAGTVDFAMGTAITTALYMVKADVGDAVPGYLDSKVGNSMEVTALDVLDVRTNDTYSIGFGIVAAGLEAELFHNNTNTIDLVVNASGLEADLNYNATHFDENASGLFLRALGIDYTLIANNTIVVGNLNSNMFGDGLTMGAYIDVDVQNSIVFSGVSPNGILELDGDALAPGNEYLYGTNNAGVKGWLPFSTYSYWEQDAVGAGTGLFMVGSRDRKSVV